MHFVPEAQAACLPHVVVDGAAVASTVLTLSHWPHAQSPEQVAADTSAEMVLRYLDAGAGLHGDVDAATNNHFDQDGAAGLFALTDPEQGLPRRELLADLARAGDFATYQHRTAARASMALASLAAAAAPAPYPEQCAALYPEVLALLPELLDHEDRFRSLWVDEDAELDATEAAVAEGKIALREIATLDLAVITVDSDATFAGGHRFASDHAEGPHPMALHAMTACTRLLISHGARHRYVDRYETWVQYRSRSVPRRVDLAPLAAELSAADDGVVWEADRPTALTPQLAPADGATSSLPAGEVEEAVVRHLSSASPAFDPYANS